MVAVACSTGYLLAYNNELALLHLGFTLFGTALLTCGACALNAYLEREADAIMPRTCRRPLPAGIMQPSIALAAGIALIAAGSLLLFCTTNLLAGSLGLLAVFVYLVIYTPAKRLTWLNTSIGALPGAVPPLIGWASANGRIDPGGWILFVMVFLWQHIHFLTIAWLFRNDYQKAGFCMLPALDKRAERSFRLTLFAAVALLPVSLVLCGLHLTGGTYCFGSILAGALLLFAALRLFKNPTCQSAHAVMFLSLCYLPAILATIMVDRYGFQETGRETAGTVKRAGTAMLPMTMSAQENGINGEWLKRRAY